MLPAQPDKIGLPTGKGAIIIPIITLKSIQRKGAESQSKENQFRFFAPPRLCVDPFSHRKKINPNAHNLRAARETQLPSSSKKFCPAARYARDPAQLDKVRIYCVLDKSEYIITLEGRLRIG
jgi:hypothetical protein